MGHSNLNRAEKDSVIGKSRSLSNIHMRCSRERVSSRVSDGLARYVSYFPFLIVIRLFWLQMDSESANK